MRVGASPTRRGKRWLRRAVLLQVVVLVAGEVRENLQFESFGMSCGFVVHRRRALVHRS